VPAIIESRNMRHTKLRLENVCARNWNTAFHSLSVICCFLLELCHVASGCRLRSRNQTPVSHALRMVFEVKCRNGTAVCIEEREALNLLNLSSFRK